MTPTDVPGAAIPGRVVDDRIVPAGGEWSGVVPAGQVLRIVDLEGRQAVDFLCYNAADPSERYNAADTMKFAGTVFLTTGHGLYSGLGRRLFTIVADTCGRHDTIGGCCSAESNRLRYGVEGTPNCRDNFLRALERFGLGRKDIVANLNFFMNVPVALDGAMAIVDGWSKPGDHVDLLAETDVLVAVSNCPQIYNPCNGGRPTPIRWWSTNPAGQASCPRKPGGLLDPPELLEMVPVVKGLEHPPLAEVHLPEREVPPRERPGVDVRQPLERLAAPLAGGPHVVKKLIDRVTLVWAHDGRRLARAGRPSGQWGEPGEVGRIRAARACLLEQLRGELAGIDLGERQVVEDLSHRPVVGARSPVRLGLREAVRLAEHFRTDRVEVAGDGIEGGG